jgi:hypothetical protein
MKDLTQQLLELKERQLFEELYLGYTQNEIRKEEKNGEILRNQKSGDRRILEQ